MIYQHVNTSIHESMNTYRTDEQKQHEPKPQTKLKPIPQAAQTHQERTTQSQGTETQTEQSQRHRTAQNATAKQATKLKAEQNDTNRTKWRKSSEQSKAGQTTEDSPQAHRFMYSGFYCVGIVEHGGKFCGVWGIVWRDKGICVCIYLHIYVHIYYSGRFFVKLNTHTRPQPRLFFKISTVTNSYNLVTKGYK